jgi:hypothetical protein
LQLSNLPVCAHISDRWMRTSSPSTALEKSFRERPHRLRMTCGARFVRKARVKLRLFCMHYPNRLLALRCMFCTGRTCSVRKKSTLCAHCSRAVMPTDGRTDGRTDDSSFVQRVQTLVQPRTTANGRLGLFRRHDLEPGRVFQTSFPTFFWSSTSVPALKSSNTTLVQKILQWKEAATCYYIGA